VPRRRIDPEILAAALADPDKAARALAHLDAEDQKLLADELAYESFYSFVRQAWQVIEAEPYVDNWHVRALCEALQAVEDGRLRRLVISVPPGTGKSLITSVMWSAWLHLRHPQWRIISGTYALDLTVRDSVRARDVISSDWYQGLVDGAWRLKSDQNVKSFFSTSRGGNRIALSVGSAGTGHRADVLIVDDVVNADEHITQEMLAVGISWFKGRMRTRLDPRTGRIVVIGQRLHDADLPGTLIDDGWPALVLPMEYDASETTEPPIPESADPRTEDGELLFPAIFDRDSVEDLKRDLGPRAASAQLQQKPSASDGTIFTVDMLRFWIPEEWEFASPRRAEVRGVFVPHDVKRNDQDAMRLASWDLSFKGGSKNDFVAGHLWEVQGANVYLIDRRHERMGFRDTRASMLETREKWNAHAVLVEDKANGPAILDELKGSVPGLIPVTPKGSKEARAESCVPQMAAGQVYLPHPSLAPWVLDVIREMLSFPSSKNDDDVDAMTQALTYARDKTNRQSKTARAKRLARMRF
jgi:predicted phage terminase large subunit-like protein